MIPSVDFQPGMAPSVKTATALLFWKRTAAPTGSPERIEVEPGRVGARRLDAVDVAAAPAGLDQRLRRPEADAREALAHDQDAAGGQGAGRALLTRGVSKRRGHESESDDEGEGGAHVGDHKIHGASATNVQAISGNGTLGAGRRYDCQGLGGIGDPVGPVAGSLSSLFAMIVGQTRDALRDLLCLRREKLVRGAAELHGPCRSCSPA